jgi:hypothetical protein
MAKTASQHLLMTFGAVFLRMPANNLQSKPADVPNICTERCKIFLQPVSTGFTFCHSCNSSASMNIFFAV